MLDKISFVDKLCWLLLTFLFFSFFIDSGDPIGIRKLALLVIAFLFAKYVSDFSVTYFSRLVAWAYIFICMLGIYSTIWSCINGVIFSSTLPWLVPLLLMPVFCFILFQFKPAVVRLSFITAGYLFSTCVIIVFLCIYIYGDLVKAFFYSLDFPGWFYLRGDGYPQVYFQSTLAFVVLSLYSALMGYRVAAIVFFLSLALSLSRFGAFVVILFVALNYILGEIRFAKLSFFLMIFLSVASIPIMMVIYMFLPPDIDYQSSSETVRFGHVMSVFSAMRPIDYIFGMGPGSVFYSSGFNEVVDNIEVSQLELFRKYGVLGYALFHLACVCLSLNFLKQKNYIAQICFFAFYFVAFSNPILATFMFSIFISVFLSDCNKTKRQDQIARANEL